MPYLRDLETETGWGSEIDQSDVPWLRVDGHALDDDASNSQQNVSRVEVSWGDGSSSTATLGAHRQGSLQRLPRLRRLVRGKERDRHARRLRRVGRDGDAHDLGHAGHAVRRPFHPRVDALRGACRTRKAPRRAVWRTPRDVTRLVGAACERGAAARSGVTRHRIVRCHDHDEDTLHANDGGARRGRARRDSRGGAREAASGTNTGGGSNSGRDDADLSTPRPALHALAVSRLSAPATQRRERSATA